MTFIADVFPISRTQKTLLDQCLEGLGSGDPSKSNMVNAPKHC